MSEIEQNDGKPPPKSTFTLWVADKAGNPLHKSPEEIADPCAAEARQLIFDIHIPADSESPSPADLEVYRQACKIEHVLQEVYPADDQKAEARFRPFFVRLFFIVQLALEGDVTASATNTRQSVGGRLNNDDAKAELAAMEVDLIDDEAPRVKNQHLRDLARWAAGLSAPFLLGYVVLSLLYEAPPPPPGGPSDFMIFLTKLHVEPLVAANFMLLWIGTFVGVCLSYGIRTTTFSVTDLIKPNSDYLAPHMRLLLTGTLAMLLTLISVASLGDVEIGSLKISDITGKPMLAIVVGAIMGISEQKLSGSVATRVSALFASK